MHYLIQKTTAAGKPVDRWIAAPMRGGIWTDCINDAARYESEQEAEQLRDDWNDYLHQSGGYARTRLVAEQGHLAPTLTKIAALPTEAE